MKVFTWLAVGMDHKTIGVMHHTVGSHVLYVTSTSMVGSNGAIDARLNGEQAPQRAWQKSSLSRPT